MSKRILLILQQDPFKPERLIDAINRRVNDKLRSIDNDLRDLSLAARHLPAGSAEITNLDVKRTTYENRKKRIAALQQIEVIMVTSRDAADAHLAKDMTDTIIVVVIDFSAATEGVNGNETTQIVSRALLQLKTTKSSNGSRLLIGVSALEPFNKQLRLYGCDCACDNDEPSVAQTIVTRVLAE